MEFDALYGDFWSLNYGQLYRTLDRLERAGLIQGNDLIQNGRPNRRVYGITANGRRSLDDWLLLPPTHEPRPLRDELAVRARVRHCFTPYDELLGRGTGRLEPRAMVHDAVGARLRDWSRR